MYSHNMAAVTLNIDNTYSDDNIVNLCILTCICPVRSHGETSYFYLFNHDW